MSQPPPSTISTSPPTKPEGIPPVPSFDHLDGISYLFGYPIAHSLSPLFHCTIYSSLNLNLAQHLYETISLSACLSLTKSPKFFGASVTMPFKVVIIPHLDYLTPEGAAIGAINTIYWKKEQGKRILCGTNTDCIGIREAILRNSPKAKIEGIKGGKGMIIGGGGTSRAAVYALKKSLGCTEIYLVNRDPKEVELVIAECTSKGFGDGLKYVSSLPEVEELEAPSVIVSAIPDFEPVTEAERRTRDVIKAFLQKEGKDGKGVILEMCYHPSPNTRITKMALDSGWRVVGGTEAMIWQGFEQSRVWQTSLGLEVKLPVEKVRRVIKAKLERSMVSNL